MKINLLLLLLGFNNFIYAQEFPILKGDYLGQTIPGDTPVVFARGIVSTDDLEHSPASFSPDGNEVFWWVNRRPGPNSKKWTSWGMTMRRIGNQWTAPSVSPYNGPIVFSPDGCRRYFSSKMDIWFVDKQGDNWSEPKCLNLVVRDTELQFAISPSIARNGTLYFVSIAESLGLQNNYGIYRSELINGEYTKPELLPRNINLPPFLNWTPFIAPDESYMIFSSNRYNQADDGDLYICFRQPDGSWTDPVNMGEPINSKQQERFPELSPDGKYLFFTRWTPDHDHDVFWVSAKIIDRLREKNNIKK